MDKLYCPACGSQNITHVIHEETKQLTLGPSFSYEEVVFTCNVCGASGDFQDVNDCKFLEAQKAAQDISVKEMIKSLSEEHYISMAYFERAFELPARTLTRWKNGDFSSTSLALLRIVQTFPWMPRVAEIKFDPSGAQQLMLKEAVNIFASWQSNLPPFSLEGVQVKSITTYTRVSYAVSGDTASQQPRLVAAGE